MEKREKKFGWGSKQGRGWKKFQLNFFFPVALPLSIIPRLEATFLDGGVRDEGWSRDL